MAKNPPAMQETPVGSLGQEDPLEKEMATHSSILARRIPWTEESGGLQSMGSQSQTRLSSKESDTTKWQRVRHDWVAHTQLSSGLHYFQWYVLPFYFCPSMTFSLYFEHFLFITGFYLIMICLVVLLFTFLLAFVNLPEFVRLWFSSQLESL